MKHKLKLSLVLAPFISSSFRDTGMKQSLPNIGVAYLAANAGALAQVRIHDCVPRRMGLDGLMAELAEFGPDIVGFNAPTFKILDTHAAAEAVKAALPGVLTIIGGDHATAVPEDTLREFPAFDLLAYGEGEETLGEILERVQADGTGADFSGIAGTCTRSGGEIVKALPRPFIRDLDALEFPAFQLMPFKEYKGVFTIFAWDRRSLTLSTGRGCRYKCVFCNRTIGGRYRSRSVPSVLDEVERDLREFGVREFYITDESLLSEREHITQFCEGYMERGFSRRISWICFSRVDEVDPEILALMKRAGCRIVSYGIESGNQEVLKIVKKGIKLEQAVRAVRWTKEAGLLANTNFMIGLPGDTPETIRDTINFAFRTDGQIGAFQMMVPFPGTEAMEMAERGEGGVKILTRDYDKFCKGIGGAHEMETVPRAELEKLQRNAWLRYYLRPSKIYYLLMFFDIKMLFVGSRYLLSSAWDKLSGRRPRA